MDGPAVVADYHDLYQVERSFRTAKSDLAGRPMFHRIRDSIQAHLTVVFAALAVSRDAQARTGVSIRKDRPNAQAAANRHHQPRSPTAHRAAAHPRVSPDHPQRPRRGCH
jgi:hypothetical protein